MSKMLIARTAFWSDKSTSGFGSHPPTEWVMLAQMHHTEQSMREPILSRQESL